MRTGSLAPRLETRLSAMLRMLPPATLSVRASPVRVVRRVLAERAPPDLARAARHRGREMHDEPDRRKKAESRAPLKLVVRMARPR